MDDRPSPPQGSETVTDALWCKDQSQNFSTDDFSGHTSREYDKSKEDPRKPVAELLQELGQEGKSVYNTWAQSFGVSESFELFCPARIDHLLAEAYALEKKLIQRKAALLRRVQAIARKLQAREN